MNWVVNSNKKIKCVVLCAGEGKRIRPADIGKPKVMIEVDNKPILSYVINYWNKYTDEFIFVVKYKKESIIDYVKKLSIKSLFVEQVELKGIAHALLYTENIVSENFIVVLGDCACKGTFIYPNDMDQGVGVWSTKNENYIRQSYSVEIKNNLVARVVEKPKKIVNSLCGMGFYFFNKRIFKYIKKAKPSELRNEIEITDVIQNMINSGEKISPVFFEGEYLNITYEEDLNTMLEMFKNENINL